MTRQILPVFLVAWEFCIVFAELVPSGSLPKRSSADWHPEPNLRDGPISCNSKYVISRDFKPPSQ